MHSLLASSPDSGWTFLPETPDAFRARYTGFACGFYDYLALYMPERFQHLRLFRSETRQTEDSYAVCEAAHPFAIQLDPLCAVICLWDDDTHTEIGTWWPDPFAKAAEFIRQHFPAE